MLKIDNNFFSFELEFIISIHQIYKTYFENCK